jgi:hypothetical protein
VILGTDIVINMADKPAVLDRGRTTTGMVCGCLVASVLSGSYKDLEYEDAASPFELIEGVSEEEAYLNGKNSV